MPRKQIYRLTHEYPEPGILTGGGEGTGKDIYLFFSKDTYDALCLNSNVQNIASDLGIIYEPGQGDTIEIEEIGPVPEIKLCDHLWVDISNPVVFGGEICTECYAVK